MKEKVLRFGSYLLVAVVTAAVSFGLAGYEGPSKLDQLEELIASRFIGEYEAETIQNAAADAMIKATGDRWSYYIPASEYEAYQEQMANAYVGVGITIQLDEVERGYRIIDVAAGGPAEEAGLQVGDLLIEAADQSIREMDVTQVRDLVKGKEGTFVSLRILRKGEGMGFQVERRTVKYPVATYELIAGNIGLVTIENFDTRCAEETLAAIETLLENGAKKLIFDVRNNPGGYADELVKVLDYLLPEGELFRTVRYDGEEHVDMSDADCLELPMAVLVNGESYSAAEFFAAALREYDAAVVIGEKTVGKGYFQTTYTLNDGSAVSLSIGKYFTPEGISLAEAGGLTPDQEIALTQEQAQELYYGTLAPDRDPHIQAAIAALR